MPDRLDDYMAIHYGSHGTAECGADYPNGWDVSGDEIESTVLIAGMATKP